MIIDYIFNRLTDFFRIIFMVFVGFVLVSAVAIIIAIVYTIFESVKDHKNKGEK
ncbi:MAG: hypothetical protein J6U54_11695 [Clostridiales bacterium]|nr:hypothetical protein [Clostridiales bacterium]